MGARRSLWLCVLAVAMWFSGVGLARAAEEGEEDSLKCTPLASVVALPMRPGPPASVSTPVLRPLERDDFKVVTDPAECTGNSAKQCATFSAQRKVLQKLRTVDEKLKLGSVALRAFEALQPTERKADEYNARIDRLAKCGEVSQTLVDTLDENVGHYAAELRRIRTSHKKADDPRDTSDIARDLRFVRFVGLYAAEFERALSAKSGGEGVSSYGGIYFAARSLREDADALLPELRAHLEVSLARCRLETSASRAEAETNAEGSEDASCVNPTDLEDLLGHAPNEFPTVSLTAQSQLKSLGSGTVSAPAAELLSLTTKFAIKRAKRNSLAMLHAKLTSEVCKLERPSNAKPLFPETCRMLGTSSLEQIITDPRQLQPALTADLVVLAEAGVREAMKCEGQDCKVEELSRETILLALDLVAHVKNAQLPVSSAADARALVRRLANFRLNDTKVPVLSLAFETLGLYVARGGRVDVASIVDELTQALPTVTFTAEQQRRASELALLGVRALGLAKEASATTSHDAWRAAIELTFEVARTALPGVVEDEKELERVQEIIADAEELSVALADGNTAAAITSATTLAIRLLPLTKGACSSAADRKTKACRFGPRLERTSAVLSGVASYSVTYVAAAQAGKSDAELRAAREQALEGVIDLMTQRSRRHGEVVVGLGIPVGFSAGGQVLFKDRDGDGNAGASLEGMPPQLSVPLGIGVQLLPGLKYRRGCRGRCQGRRPPDPTKWGVGFHGFASLLDLGQFAAYDDQGEINQIRWDSIISPGLQAGLAVGTPANVLVIAADARYAPTLFSGTSNLTVLPEQRGGAVRFGLTLAYYVPLVDFN